MIVVNTEFIPDKKIKEIKGLVQGNTVRAKHMGRDIIAGLKKVPCCVREDKKAGSKEVSIADSSIYEFLLSQASYAFARDIPG